MLDYNNGLKRQFSSYKQTDWLTEWLTDWPNDRRRGLRKDRKDWPIHWLIDWLANWPTFRPTDRTNEHWTNDRANEWRNERKEKTNITSIGATKNILVLSPPYLAQGRLRFLHAFDLLEDWFLQIIKERTFIIHLKTLLLNVGCIEQCRKSMLWFWWIKHSTNQTSRRKKRIIRQL